jgi:protein KRI1
VRGDGNAADADGVDFEKKLGDYFGGEGELDEGSMFLRDFFKNKMWLGKDERDDVGEDEVDELLRDEEEVERQEKYEESYNFRYEESVGDRVLGHSRKVEGSVRKKDNSRKEQRKNKEERMKIAEMERKEELKHLKNLKKKEMKEKMKKVMEVAGFKDDNEFPLDLEDEFDPDEYDKMMKKAFDVQYYEAEDVEPGFGSDDDNDEMEKPDFDKEDELLGLPKDWDMIDSSDGFLAARERSLKLKQQKGNDCYEKEEGSGEERSDESKRKRKRKMSLVQKVKEEMMEEYYKLDYEGTIGDLKTRFKYAKVDPNKFGLKTEEILEMDDKELNQYVSIKKLAPYMDKEWKVPSTKKHQQKMMIRERLQEKFDKKNKTKHKKDKPSSVLGSKQDGTEKLDESNVDTGNLSRKAKRRRRQAELKLSRPRLIAYGKVQS